MPGGKRQKLAATGASSLNKRNLPRKSKTAQRNALASGSDSEFAPDPTENRSKKRKVASSSSTSRSSKQDDGLFQRLFDQEASVSAEETCVPPSRLHSVMYHRPLLLDGQLGRPGRRSLLSWFDSVSESRSMPWRRPWVNPRDISDPAELRRTLEQRAYQVWISEIMLQQTRVAVVIDYWNRWMSKWPTIQDLAAAKSEDVLAAWSGLGYYSRATRIHEAAKLAVNDPGLKGLLPSSAKELEAKMPGVGRYTAGAISSIVFGRAEPMVDGNVLRVLSRQLGIHGNIKTNKAVIDMIWAAADAIVKGTSACDGDDSEGVTDGEPNDRPGRWGQGLMELGSTVCTPKPNCSLCPITSTCRVYNEGQAMTKAAGDAASIVDIEDLCSLCEPFEGGMEDSGEETSPKDGKGSSKKSASKSTNQPTLASFAFTRKTNGASATNAKPLKANIETIANYARKFPVKVIKKAVREEETLVCAIRRSSDGHYLIHRRPLKGLLAGLWELPSKVMEMPANGTVSSKKREQMARAYVSSLVGGKKGDVEYAGELGSVPWLFSHIKLTMHVHAFEVDDADEGEDSAESRWVLDVNVESMGTGMRKCWAMVKEAAERDEQT